MDPVVPKFVAALMCAGFAVWELMVSSSRGRWVAVAAYGTVAVALLLVLMLDLYLAWRSRPAAGLASVRAIVAAYRWAGISDGLFVVALTVLALLVAVPAAVEAARLLGGHLWLDSAAGWLIAGPAMASAVAYLRSYGKSRWNVESRYVDELTPLVLDTALRRASGADPDHGPLLARPRKLSSLKRNAVGKAHRILADYLKEAGATEGWADWDVGILRRYGLPLIPYHPDEVTRFVSAMSVQRMLTRLRVAEDERPEVAETARKLCMEASARPVRS
jgi:hypothetical protein